MNIQNYENIDFQTINKFNNYHEKLFKMQTNVINAKVFLIALVGCTGMYTLGNLSHIFDDPQKYSKMYTHLLSGSIKSINESPNFLKLMLKHLVKCPDIKCEARVQMFRCVPWFILGTSLLSNYILNKSKNVISDAHIYYQKCIDNCFEQSYNAKKSNDREKPTDKYKQLMLYSSHTILGPFGWWILKPTK